jgi:hypothetical protein
MPQIAFFALRDIKKGEELSFDYSPPPQNRTPNEPPAVEAVPKEEAEKVPAKKLDFGDSCGEFLINWLRRRRRIPPISYYWTVPLILDHSYLVGK